jgi:hypothetical protein
MFPFGLLLCFLKSNNTKLNNRSHRETSALIFDKGFYRTPIAVTYLPNRSHTSGAIAQNQPHRAWIVKVTLFFDPLPHHPK